MAGVIPVAIGVNIRTSFSVLNGSGVEKHGTKRPVAKLRGWDRRAVFREV